MKKIIYITGEQASGKTLLAESICQLSTGEVKRISYNRIGSIDFYCTRQPYNKFISVLCIDSYIFHPEEIRTIEETVKRGAIQLIFISQTQPPAELKHLIVHANMITPIISNVRNMVTCHGFNYWYEYRLAKDGDMCLSTNDPLSYCNGVYKFSSKDPGDGMAFVITKTNNLNICSDSSAIYNE